MTTDDLIERIARVLDPWIWTDEDDDPSAFRRFARRSNRLAGRPASLARAAAVLPIVEAEVRAAKAEALREAAENVDVEALADAWTHGAVTRLSVTNAVAEVLLSLRNRATEYEAGGSDDHR